jgi:hypothetical protein
MVMEYSRGYEGLRDFDLWMAAAGIELAAVDADQAHIARQAFRQYGKGRPLLPWISAIVFLMPSPKRPDSRCYSKGRISERPIFRRQCREQRVGEGRVGGFPATLEKVPIGHSRSGITSFWFTGIQRPVPFSLGSAEAAR